MLWLEDWSESGELLNQVTAKNLPSMPFPDKFMCTGIPISQIYQFYHCMRILTKQVMLLFNQNYLRVIGIWSKVACNLASGVSYCKMWVK